MEYRDPKKIRELLINIEKRVESNTSSSLQEIILQEIQVLIKKHEATVALATWQFTVINRGDLFDHIDKGDYDADTFDVVHFKYGLRSVKLKR